MLGEGGGPLSLRVLKRTRAWAGAGRTGRVRIRLRLGTGGCCHAKINLNIESGSSISGEASKVLDSGEVGGSCLGGGGGGAAPSWIRELLAIRPAARKSSSQEGLRARPEEGASAVSTFPADPSENTLSIIDHRFFASLRGPSASRIVMLAGSLSLLFGRAKESNPTRNPGCGSYKCWRMITNFLFGVGSVGHVEGGGRPFFSASSFMYR